MSVIFVVALIGLIVSMVALVLWSNSNSSSITLGVLLLLVVLGFLMAVVAAMPWPHLDPSEIKSMLTDQNSGVVIEQIDQGQKATLFGVTTSSGERLQVICMTTDVKSCYLVKPITGPAQ